jgi:hypothetical protein
LKQTGHAPGRWAELDGAALGWSERAAWDGLAGYYADLPDPG